MIADTRTKSKPKFPSEFETSCFHTRTSCSACHASCVPLISQYFKVSVTEYPVNMTTQVSVMSGSHSHGPTNISVTCAFVCSEILQLVSPRRLDRRDINLSSSRRFSLSHMVLGVYYIPREALSTHCPIVLESSTLDSHACP